MSNKNSNWPAARISEFDGAVTTAIAELRDQESYDHRDLQVLDSKIRHFFSYCSEHNLRPGIELLCAALGISRNTLLAWSRGGDQRADLINEAKQLISAILEQMGLCGQVNPTVLIWTQKNNFGYKDTVEIEQAQANPFSDLPTLEDIKRRIPAEIEDDSTEDDTDFFSD